MQSLSVTGSGAALAFHVTGTDDGSVPVVHLGGLGSSGTVAFLPVLAHSRYAATGSKIVVDLIGSGWSDHDDTFDHTIDAHARTVVTLITALGLESVALVGHSLGGSIAISLAAQRPDLVATMAVAEPNLDPGVGSFSALVAAVDEDTFAASEHAALITSLRGPDLAADDFARTVARWSARGLHRTAVSLLADRPVTFRDQLAAFAGPKRYVSGARSDEDLDPLIAAGCDVRVVPEAGHVMMADNVDGFVDALL